jgi:broad specificity phosphatase PhoE
MQTQDPPQVTQEKPKNLTPTGSSSFFFLIRHGQRRDDQEGRDKTNLKSDPDITEYGQIQSSETGRQIAKLVSKYIIDGKLNSNVRVKLLTSPYLRCIKTAYGISKGLGSYALGSPKILFPH